MIGVNIEVPIDKQTAVKGYRKNIKDLEEFVLNGINSSAQLISSGHPDLYMQSMSVINHFATKLSFLYLELSDQTSSKQESEENILRAVDLNPNIIATTKHIIITENYQLRRKASKEDKVFGSLNYSVIKRSSTEVTELNKKIQEAKEKLVANPNILEQYTKI